MKKRYNFNMNNTQITQRLIGEMCGVSLNTVNRWVSSNETKEMTPETVIDMLQRVRAEKLAQIAMQQKQVEMMSAYIDELQAELLK